MIKNKILSQIKELFPQAQGELNYTNLYELIVAVILSAQTTDVRVNMVTPALFKKYSNFNELACADVDELSQIISSVGLYLSKAKNLIKMANQVINDFNGILPQTEAELTLLAGVGRKTANVVLSEGFNIPAIAVDTHVLRVSNRLGLAKSNNPDLVEKALKELFHPSEWREAHHLLIHFGRYLCKARKPECFRCPLDCPARETPYQKTLP